MIQHLINILLDKKKRESLVWNLYRVWYEHVYYDELHMLCDLIDTKQYNKAKDYATWLREQDTPLHYLEPAIIRLETLNSFIAGED